MEKKHQAALLAGAAGLWWIRRDVKYPVRRELRPANQLSVPGWSLNLATARLSNRLLETMDLPEPPPGVTRETLRFLSQEGVSLPLTLYRPEGAPGPLPCLVYLHGGGFCARDAGYIHRYAAQYAQRSGCLVAFVHYRTADRVPFPGPFQDCFSALRWVWANAPALGVDPARLAVGGDSAGGALAAACALRARDEGGPPLCFQLLIYPVTDCRMETASMARYTDSPMWNARLNRRMWELYLREGISSPPEYASPLLARDLSRLPPAYVEAQEFDCLHDEAVAYAGALEGSGVPVELEDVRGTFHGFDYFRHTAIAQTMMEKRILALRRAFRTL